jgi:hypothetical protein
MNDDQRPEWAVRIQTEREARGWGKWEMGRRLLRTVGIEPTPSKLKSLARQMLEWEKGHHFPRDWATPYTEAFGILHEKLFGPAEDTAVPAGTVNVSPSGDVGSDEMRRRAALQMLSALGAGAAIPPGTIEHVLAAIDDTLDNPLDLDEWDATVHEYGQQLIVRPTGALIADLTADILAVGEQLQRPRPDAERAGLLRVSAGLSGLLAIDLGDAGNTRGARLSWATACRAADSSGDQALRVWVRGRAAQEAFWVRRSPGVVNDLVDKAVHIAAGTPLPGVARALAARAYMTAAHGDTVQANTALQNLDATFDRLPHDQALSALGFQETQLRWTESYVHTFAGDAHADDALTRALAIYPPDARGPIANLKLMQAATLVREREIDAGLQQAITTLETWPVTAARGFLAGQVLKTLPAQAQSLPAARELRTITAGVA